MDCKKIVVLIDGDNTNASYADVIYKQISQIGLICVNRIYGDWSSNQLVNWKNKLETYAITPIQQFAYVKGKNASDISLVIDTMLLLNKNLYDVFCI